MSDDGNNPKQDNKKIEKTEIIEMSVPSEADLWKSRVQSRPAPKTDPPVSWAQNSQQDNSKNNNEQK